MAASVEFLWLALKEICIAAWTSFLLVPGAIFVIFNTVIALTWKFRAWSFFIFSLFLLSLILMPVVENQQPILDAAQQNVENFYDEINNTLIFPLLNPLLACIDPVFELFNRIVFFVEAIIWRMGQEFGIELFPFASFEGTGRLAKPFSFRDATGNTTVLDYLTPMEISMLEEWSDAARTVQSTRDFGHVDIDLEMRSKAVGYEVYRTLLYPKMQQRGFSEFLVSFCDGLHTALAVLIDLADIIVEFVLFLYDLIEEAVEKLIDGDIDVEFVLILVRAILEIFLLLLDPKGCFRDFPSGFPQTIFPCLCSWVYESVADVPSNVISALGGCICPGFDVTGDIIEGILKPCQNFPFLKYLIDSIEIVVDILESILDAIDQIRIRINRIIDRIRDLIDKILDLIGKKRTEFTTKDGKIAVIERTTEDGYDVFHLYVNSTEGITRSVRKARVPGIGWFDALQERVNKNADHVMNLRALMFGHADKIREVMDVYDHHAQIAVAVRADMAEHIAEWREDKEEKEKPRTRSAFDSDYWQRSVATETLGETFFGDLLNQRLHLSLAKAIDRHSNESHWEKIVRSAPDICGDDCVDDVGTLVRFVRELMQHGSRIIRDGSERSPQMKRSLLQHMDFGEARTALRRTAEAVRNHRDRRAVQRGDPSAMRARDFVRDLETCGNIGLTAVFKPWKLATVVKQADQKSAERVVSWFENRAAVMKEMSDAPSVAAARHILAEDVRKFHGTRAVDAARATVENKFVPVIIISISVIGGVAAVATVSVLGVATAALAPLLPILAILGAALLFSLFNVLVRVGTSQTIIFFTGEIHSPDIFNPLIVLFEESLGNIFQNGFDGVDTSTLGDQLTTIVLADGWYIVVQVLRGFLGIIPFVGAPPDLLFDPNSGLALGDLASWALNIINCNPDESCILPGAYGAAPCRCQSPSPRYATDDWPCAIGDGKYSCYPYIDLGTQLRGFTAPGLAFNCAEAFGYPETGYMWGSAPFPNFLWTWMDAGARVAQVAFRRLLNGWSLPEIGIFAGLVGGFCPCFRMFTGFLWKATAISIIFRPIFTLFIGEYFRDMVNFNRGSFATDWLEAWVTDEELLPHQQECAIRYSPALGAMISTLLLITIPLVVGLVLGGFIWFLHLLFVLWVPFDLTFKFLLYILIAIDQSNRPAFRVVLVQSIGQAMNNSVGTMNDRVERLYKKK